MLLRARVSPGILLLKDAHQLDWGRCSQALQPSNKNVLRKLAVSSSNLNSQRKMFHLVVTASNQESCMHEDLVDGCMPTARLSSHIFLVACAATCLAALSRTAFSVLALPMFDQYCLPSKYLGSLQATLLTGYLIGQIPAGILADRLGGCGPLALGILIWSLATAAIGILLHPSPIAPPIPTLIAAHAIFGLSQSILMPGVSATASRWFPPSQRGLKTSTVYSWYNVGNVVGLAALPALSIGFGWATGYLLVGGVGTAVSIAALRWVVPQSYLPTSRVDSHRTIELHKPFDRALLLLTKYHKEIALLSWTHAVIGLGFFVLQAWVPLYILSLPPHPSTSTTSFATVGLFSAAPWLATAVTARFAGQLADWLHTSKRMTSLAVRRWMQITSHFGGSLAMLLLALLPSFQSIIPSSRELALALLCLAIATQGLNYAGFHSYIQDVAPGDAGLILGLTNSCSILAGILGNLIMFHLASVPGPTGYGSLFAIMSLAYCASGAAWAWGARGRSIKL